MGIYDREYYRDESGGSGWFSGVAPACKTIIAINVGLFFVFWVNPQLPLHSWLVADSGDILKHGYIWKLLTATFVHSTDNLFHVAFNMLFLWVLGREMEERYGSREFTFFYLTAAIFSTLVWAVIDLFSSEAPHHMVGASGAVMAVATLYVTWYPRRELLLFFVIPVQAWMLLAGYVGYDGLMLLQNVKGGGQGHVAVAFAAHLGGAGYGYMYKQFDLRWSNLLSLRGRKPRLRIVSPPREAGRERPSPLPTASSRSASVGTPSKSSSAKMFPEEQLDARLDEVLAKIAREGGRNGLTEEENFILQEASRRARDRRTDRP
jgi:membrane associated rhomboid family serine protease